MQRGKPSPLATLLKLPAFLSSICFLYWSFPLAVLTGRINVLRLWGRRNDNYQWASSLLAFFRVQLRVLDTQGLYTRGQCIYLCNHRSWGDFFIDCYLTQGRAQMMSRWMVFWALPIFMVSGMAIKAVLLFKRQHIADKERFNLWVDDKLKHSPTPSLLVYPEGHRSTAMKSLPLKRGMLHYAFSRKLPVQVIITSGKERVLSEKTFDVRFGEVLKVGFSPVLHTKDYEDFDSFFNELQNLWDNTWDQVARAEVAKLEPLIHAPQGVVYPWSLRVKQLLAAFTAIALMLLTIRLTCVYAPLIVASFGQAKQVVLLVVLVLTLLSFSNAGLNAPMTISSKQG